MNETELQRLVSQIVREVVRRVLRTSLADILAALDTSEPVTRSEFKGVSAGILAPFPEREEQTLITEADVYRISRSGQKVIRLPKGALVTPLAKDAAAELKIQLMATEVS